MREIGILLAALSLSGCVTDSSHDMMGRLYPEVCRGDLSTVNANVKYVSSVNDLPKTVAGGDNWGYTYADENPAEILIWSGAPAQYQADILTHERCHVLAGAWHK